MDARALRRLLAAAALAAAAPAGAQPPSSPCELPGPEREPLAHRADLLAEYEQLPRSCLQAIFTTCASASSRTLLDFGSAAVCSFGYEALLKQHFHGNFRALLAWWRTLQDPDAP